MTIRIQQIKLHHVDKAARTKGFRANRRYWVVGQESTLDRMANPARGPLYFVSVGGRIEGFFADQFRVVKRGWHWRLEQVVAGLRANMAPHPHWARDLPVTPQFSRPIYAKD